MSIINGIDYDRLARIAETSRASFHKLCERAEAGLDINDLDTIISTTDSWLNYQQAAKVLMTTDNSLYSIMSRSNRLEYWGVQWKSRSIVKAKGKRGCGVLFSRKDLEKIVSIRKATGLGIKPALRVFQAIKEGKI